MGTQVMRIIIPNGAEALTKNLYNAGYGVTQVDGQGATGPVKLIYTVAKRKGSPGAGDHPPDPPACLSFYRRCALNPRGHLPHPGQSPQQEILGPEVEVGGFLWKSATA